jgi:hypothetical protein
MSQSVSHYLVDWNHFLQMWQEEENPDDALEHAERRSTRDDYYSMVARASNLYSSVRAGDSSDENVDEALDEIVCAFCAHHRDNYRDLPDDFAYEDGGFSVVIEPANVTRLVGSWRGISSGDLEARFRQQLKEEDARELLQFLQERMALLELAAATSRGYVARLG